MAMPKREEVKKLQKEIKNKGAQTELEIIDEVIASKKNDIEVTDKNMRRVSLYISYSQRKAVLDKKDVNIKQSLATFEEEKKKFKKQLAGYTDLLGFLYEKREELLQNNPELVEYLRKKETPENGEDQPMPTKEEA